MDTARQLIGRLGHFVKNLSRVQMFALGGVVLLVMLSLWGLFRVSLSSDRITLFGVPIADEYQLSRIIYRLDEEGVHYSTDEAGFVYLDNINVARRMRTLMVREELVPSNVDPWSLFDMERWTLTDFERDVNFRRSLVRELEQHIGAIEGIDAVNVMLAFPENSLLAEERAPTTVSVRLTLSPGSRLVTDIKQVRGIVRLVQTAIPNVVPENISVIDSTGTILNDFQAAEQYDRLSIAEKERRLKLQYESQIHNRILEALEKVLPQRYSLTGVSVNLDTSKRTSEKTLYNPIELVPQNPDVPYNTREVSTDVLISSEASRKNYEGTGYSPWGPPGQEGQTPPEYQDKADVIGRYDENLERKNFALNTEQVTEEKSPVEIARISVGVFVDGAWQLDYSPDGLFIIENGVRKRTFTPASAQEISTVKSVIEGALRAEVNNDRDVSVVVSAIQFQRSEQFKMEDAQYFFEQQRRAFIIYGFSGLFLLGVIFLVLRIIFLRLERRRRLREEELARQAHLQQQQLALEDTEGISFEEIADDLKTHAARLVRDNPENVAKLIKTWLVEEKVNDGL